MQHSFLTFAIPFSRQHRPAVEAALDALQNPNYDRDHFYYAIEKLHFMSGSVIPGELAEPDHLLLEMTVDGSEAEGLKLLDGPLGERVPQAIQATNAGIAAPYSKSLVPIRTGQGLLDNPGLNFIGTPGMSVTRIRQELRLARILRDHFDATGSNGDPLGMLRDARRVIAANDEVKGLLVPEATPLLGPAASPGGLSIKFVLRVLGSGVLKLLWPILLLALVTGLVVAAPSSDEWSLAAFCAQLSAVVALGLGGLLAAIALIAWGLRRQETSDVADNSVPDQRVLLASIGNESHSSIMQNHLTGVSRVKPGWIRKLTLRMAFLLIGQAARWIYRPGYLGSLGTIHSARWVLLPGTDKLVFLSNYGGSWESYLEDFITKASSGLTAVWSNTLGYPQTRFLLLDGATDGDRFKRWARRQQVPTRFWYSAYYSVTTARIRTNAAIRHGLATASTVDEAQAWLALFGSNVRDRSTVEVSDVQSLMMSGFGSHRHACAIFLTLPEEPGAAKNWLADRLPSISFGTILDSECVQQLGLTHSGLQKLGMQPEELDEFSVPFREGIASKLRQRILADTGEDAPDKWLWGNPKNGENDKASEGIVDAALLIYAKSGKLLASKRNDALAGLGGCKEVHTVHTDRTDDPTLGPPREPFGFTDGISQPIIRGLSDKIARYDAQHIVEPGEFILGYKDNRGFVVDTPSIAATRDPENLLPSVEPMQAPDGYPTFNRSGGNTRRAVGRNGSYLVIRQLKQKPAAFEAFLDEQEARIAKHPAVAHLCPMRRREYIGAKMIGRWKDGSSLVRFPDQPASGWDGKQTRVLDNDFLLGAEDPIGEACPFGSHIRRSNPRDSFEPGSKEQIAITNRHRILRRGRFYCTSPNDDDATRTQANRDGLLFMCLNADIERQFEFIQQTWSMAYQFHGLDNESDPILVRGVEHNAAKRKLARLTIPTPHGQIQLRDFKDLVDVVGGAYLFLPGRRMLDWLARSA